MDDVESSRREELEDVIKDSKAIGQDRINNIPPVKQNWQVSEADTHEIARRLGTWWEILALEIGFSEEVGEIRSQYRNDLEMQKYQLMLKWNNKNGRKANYGIILAALRKLEQINCLDEVCKLLQAQSEPGPPPPTTLDRYRDELKRGYSRYKLKAIVKWPPPLNEKFIKLAMIKDNKIKRGEIDQEFVGMMRQGNVENVLSHKTEIRPDEIFDIAPVEGKVILLEGAPGSGKTTFCWYMCQQWGKGESFQQFSHVLMVELRDEYIQSAKCLADILPYSEGNEARIAEDMMKKKGENILIILEGWDELPKAMQQSESIFKHLIKKSPKSLLDRAVILISSRSSVTVDLQSLVKMRVEILGFTPDQIHNFINISLESEPDRAKELLTKLRQNPKLHGNCYLPLNLTLLVHMYSCNQQLPETFCFIIIELALTCLYHYRRNTLHFNDDFHSFSELPDDIKPQFQNLCRLAFEATMQEKYSFSNLQTESLGLMQTVERIAARGNKTTQYFLHSSLQELCAAIHISEQPITEQVRMLRIVLDNPNDFLLRFYSALTQWKDQSTSVVLFEYSKTLPVNLQKIITTKPEHMSQSSELILVSWLFHSLKKYIISAIEDDTFNVDNLGSYGSEHITDEVAAFLHEFSMLWNNFCNIYDLGDHWIRRLNSLTKMERVMVSHVIAPIGKKYIAFAASLYHEMNKMLCATFQQVQQSSDYTEEVLISKAMNEQLQTPEDPIRVEMGIPVPPQERISRAVLSMVHDGIMQGFSEDEEILDLLDQQLVSMPLILATMGEFSVHQIHKTIVQLRIKNLILDPSILLASKYYQQKHNLLMLIHCIHEAKNPILAQIIEPELVLSGPLNAGDIIALQSIIEEKEDGVCACNLETLCLVSTIPHTEVSVLTKTIEKNSTLRNIMLDIGCYDEILVRAVLSKSRIKSFHYVWKILKDTESCQSFFSCLSGNQNLRVLNLSTVKIGSFGAQELARVMNSTRLVEINLTFCGIEEEGIKALSTALASNVFLSVLRLDETIISPAALQSLSHSLRQNNSLKVLGIADDPMMTELVEQNLEEFLTELQFNSSVVCIVLSSFRIHSPLLRQAIRLVNCTRRVKRQPLLSIDDHYTQNYVPEMYSATQVLCTLKSFCKSVNTELHSELKSYFKSFNIKQYNYVKCISGFIKKEPLDLQPERHVYGHTTQSLSLTLSAISNRLGVCSITHGYVYPPMDARVQSHMALSTPPLGNLIITNGNSRIVHQLFCKYSANFSILLDILLCTAYLLFVTVASVICLVIVCANTIP